MLEYCRLSVGQPQSPGQLLRQLMELEYRRVDEVAEPGECALRGGVLDLFPATFEAPLRIELDDSRIASIRSFNPQTFETLDRHQMVVVLPGCLHPTAFRGAPLHPLGAPHRGISIDVPFEAFVDLREGDSVVHVNHGIGRYLGRTTIAGARGMEDALTLEYADGDRLYVPLTQLHLLQKYVAFGARAPVLHKLGGAAWEQAKTRAYVGAWLYAKTSIELQAQRLALPGYAFPDDHEWQQQFESAFPYRETPDQLRAIADVKRSMEAPQPMDRVVLGDVGYGKTEVALRAAFKAVMAHKQVAILVPTTILAYQHHRTFSRRLEGFPVQIDMLTRFQSEAEQRRTVHGLAQGRMDIVIGTHRLLSGDVRFKDLGLLIVDEEQRFGVQEKEQLKQWRSQVDVLTLSATPIPRTLYLALVGARDLSLITTPPENRHPIDTQIVEDDPKALRTWILNELERNGQVYVVHNRVYNIQRIAQQVAALVPNARLGVAHGQMAEHELEQVMIGFIEGTIEVLVTTTIIESGIDIPNANTLIIKGAEAFGLADLYQLRGRVGRFDRRAYAYLVVSKDTVLSAEARTRLDAMTEHTALGSGFKIAMEDLKLRGAGNLLGVEQSGHISAVGFDLYCRLLREAVHRLQHGEPASAPMRNRMGGMMAQTR